MPTALKLKIYESFSLWEKEERREKERAGYWVKVTGESNRQGKILLHEQSPFNCKSRLRSTFHHAFIFTGKSQSNIESRPCCFSSEITVALTYLNKARGFWQIFFLWWVTQCHFLLNFCFKNKLKYGIKIQFFEKFCTIFNFFVFEITRESVTLRGKF